MGKQCCAYGCTQTYVKNSGISLHAFPKDSIRRKIWMRNLRRKDFLPNDHTRICSKHFEEECFDREKFGGRWLKPTAAPTIFNFPPQLQPTVVCIKSPTQSSSSPSLSSSEDQEIDDQIEDEILPSSKVLKTAKRKRLNYLGDFKAGVIHSPTKLEKKWKIAQLVLQKQKRKISLLQRNQKRLEKNVDLLSVMLRELQKKDFM